MLIPDTLTTSAGTYDPAPEADHAETMRSMSSRVKWAAVGAGLTLSGLGALAVWMWAADAGSEARVLGIVAPIAAIIVGVIVAAVPEQPQHAMATVSDSESRHSTARWFGMTREWWTPPMIMLRLILLGIGLLLLFGSCQVIVVRTG